MANVFSIPWAFAKSTQVAIHEKFRKFNNFFIEVYEFFKLLFYYFCMFLKFLKVFMLIFVNLYQFQINLMDKEGGKGNFFKFLGEL